MGYSRNSSVWCGVSSYFGCMGRCLLPPASARWWVPIQALPFSSWVTEQLPYALWASPAEWK